ncbi:hypothetical protein SEVIR_7G307566v4 [Setaria viridis]|nr:uncharacterized protein LOC117863220 isoform X2 [Setaria viridis]
MADCFPPEADDLHRRWLPREIFADIGIVDTEAASDAPTEADAVGVEELAAQLAGILGGGSKVCGLEGSVAVTCGGTNAAGGGAAVSWPFVPYPSAHWQGASNLMNLGGVLDYYYSAFPPAPPCPVPPPANLRGGTGVFIPRTACTLLPTSAKGGIATRAWPGTGRPATGWKQEWQQNETTPQKPLPLPKTPQEEKATGAALQACPPRPELALPQDWSYR